MDEITPFANLPSSDVSDNGLMRQCPLRERGESVGAWYARQLNT